MHSCFVPGEILLPDENISAAQWACLACDQFTSQPAYWAEAAGLRKGKPSTLDLVLPELYLGTPEEPDCIASIHADMERYAAEVLTRKVHGFVYVERTLSDGQIRQGLVGCVDLEDYDYTPGAKPLVRPTENTVVERIPPRLAVRKDALLETPHIMMLADDPADTLLGPVAAAKEQLPCVYGGELYQGSGSIRGWAVEDPALVQGIVEAMARMGSQEEFDRRYPACAGQPPLALAVGDGNHSLATAKAHWESIKPTLSEVEHETHPARWCLAEVCNLHSPAIQMEAIHRVVFGVPAASLLLAAVEFCDHEGIEITNQRPQYEYHVVTARKQVKVGLRHCKSPLAVGVLEALLGEYLAGHKEATVDYIHGEAEVRRLAAQGNIGILLPEFQKDDLFRGVVQGGVLPKKTFSIGHAEEKRCYFECRRIRP